VLAAVGSDERGARRARPSVSHHKMRPVCAFDNVVAIDISHHKMRPVCAFDNVVAIDILHG
jgi:hypothetical protein